MALARSKKLQASARGQDCALRLIGTCNGNPETVVLCHIGKVRGIACKAGDNMAIFACSACHDAIDGRAKYDKELNHNLAEDFLRALEETQQIHIDNELMVIK